MCRAALGKAGVLLALSVSLSWGHTQHGSRGKMNAIEKEEDISGNQLT